MPRHDIMIVDDNPSNLKLLEDMLRRQGHEVRAFPRGRLALTAAAKSPPDMILLDVNMPEMDGYEVCERLKANPLLARIPVIFLSALNETEDKVKAFRAGAVDYISKPFQFEEIHARVETHLKMHELQRALQLQNEALEEKVAERTRELAEVYSRLKILDRAKGDFLSLISHEFRTPLNGIIGIGDLIFDDMPSTADNLELRHMFELSRDRILSILDDALLLTEIDVNADEFKTAPVSLNAVLQHAIANTSDFARTHRVTLSPPPDILSAVLGDEERLAKALTALIETTIKFSAAGTSIQYQVDTVPAGHRLIILCLGNTIPSSEMARFFDLFSVSEASTPGGDLGLGPGVAYRIISLYGGSVSVSNRDPAGIQFTILFKDAAPPGTPPN